MKKRMRDRRPLPERVEPFFVVRSSPRVIGKKGSIEQLRFMGGQSTIYRTEEAATNAAQELAEELQRRYPVIISSLFSFSIFSR